MRRRRNPVTQLIFLGLGLALALFIAFGLDRGGVPVAHYIYGAGAAFIALALALLRGRK